MLANIPFGEWIGTGKRNDSGYARGTSSIRTTGSSDNDSVSIGEACFSRDGKSSS
jgi:hypothetical protein